MVANVDLHKVEVSNVVFSKYYIGEYERDEVDYDVSLIHCPKDETCAVWHECHECSFTDEEIEDLLANEGAMRHGKWHIDTEFGIAVKDEPHNCGVAYTEEWGTLEEAIHEHGAGIYTFKVEFDGNWAVYDFRREEIMEEGDRG